VFEHAKNLTIVVVITGLIWWTANQQVQDSAEFTLRIGIRAADQSLLAVIEHPAPAEVVVRLTGTRGRIDAFRNLLQREPSRVFEHVLPPDHRTRGPQRMAARQVLAGSGMFRQTGLDIEDIRPAEVQLVVEALRTVSLRLEPDFGTIGVENVVCQPQIVEVHGVPESIVDTHYADGVLRAPAEHAVRQWLATHPDAPDFEINLILTIPEAPPTVEFAPSSRVRAVGRFVSVVDTAKKGPVQIVFAVPPDVQRGYYVRPSEASNLRPDVFVRGHKSLLEQLAPQQIFMYVEVMVADVAGSARLIQRVPRVVLPDGVELAREPEPVEFELIERPPSGVPVV
jgi:hypothetical protein